MSDDALGYRTHPHRIGAPLPVEMHGIEQAMPAPGAIIAELTRAQVELMYAIARHRQAWTRMRRVREDREQKGLTFLDSDREWKVATSDVAWWRDEMTAQATTIKALVEMRNLTKEDESPDSERGPNVRETVYGWDPSRPPTLTEYQAACVWRSMAGERMSGLHARRVAELIDAYRAKEGPDDIGPGWAEVTNFQEMAKGRRTFVQTRP